MKAVFTARDLTCLSESTMALTASSPASVASPISVFSHPAKKREKQSIKMVKYGFMDYKIHQI
jgi:hypothetical protein